MKLPEEASDSTDPLGSAHREDEPHGPEFQSVDWLVAQIEKLTPAKSEVRRQARQVLGDELGQLGDSETRHILSVILMGLYEHRAKTREHEVRDDAAYWRRRETIEARLEEIVHDDIVRTGPDLSSVIFYEPHEVNCVHGRHRKRCIAIRQKLEILIGGTPERRNHLTLGGRERVARACLRISSAGEQRLARELKTLDRRVDPAAADPGDFCSELLSLPVDQRARAEGAHDEGGIPWRPAGAVGKPPNSFREFLLKTVGENLHKQTWSYRRASQLMAKIELCYFDNAGSGVPDLDDVITNRAEAIERDWRQRRKGGHRKKARPRKNSRRRADC